MDEHFPEIIRQWLGNERDSNYEGIDRATKEAANICAASQKASNAAKGAEPLTRKQRAHFNALVKPIEENSLQAWAETNGLWISELRFKRQYERRQIGAGAEQKVYLHKNGRKVIKANTGTYHGNWLEFFNRILCHAILSPLQNILLLDLQILTKTLQ